MATDPEPLHCARHPSVETYLRCGKCGTPICPKCLVQTPVGARCRTCARLRRLPIYDVGPTFLLRGAGAGLTAAVAGSLLISLVLASTRFFGFFGLLLFGALYGYGVSEVVSLATNRKRGASLGWVTVFAIFLGFGLGRAVLVFVQLGAVPMPARLLQALVVGFLPEIGFLALQGIGALIAYNRLR